jgi:hypothetical protein
MGLHGNFPEDLIGFTLLHVFQSRYLATPINSKVLENSEPLFLLAHDKKAFICTATFRRRLLVSVLAEGLLFFQGKVLACLAYG